MVVESWESVLANLNVPLFVQGTFCECLQTAYTKTFTMELMNISGIKDLNKKKVEELLYLQVFVLSPRSEGWPRWDRYRGFGAFCKIQFMSHDDLG